MMKMPPPARSERKAIERPSGEKAGWVSSPGEPAVRLSGSPPAMLRRKMSLSPSTVLA